MAKPYESAAAPKPTAAPALFLTHALPDPAWTLEDLKPLFAAWKPTTAFSTSNSKLKKTIKALYGQRFGADPMPSAKWEDHKGQCDTTFGEILPKGVSKALDINHLNAAGNVFLSDLGMGNGKVLIQAFLQFPNLKKLIGVELVRERFDNAVRALKTLNTLIPTAKLVTCGTRVTLTVGGRVMEMRNENLTNSIDCLDCKCVLLEICAEDEALRNVLREFLNRFKANTRLLTYEPMCAFYAHINEASPWKYFAGSSRFPTSWNPGDAEGDGGHQFYLSVKQP